MFNWNIAYLEYRIYKKNNIVKYKQSSRLLQKQTTKICFKDTKVDYQIKILRRLPKQITIEENRSINFA